MSVITQVKETEHSKWTIIIKFRRRKRDTNRGRRRNKTNDANTHRLSDFVYCCCCILCAMDIHLTQSFWREKFPTVYYRIFLVLAWDSFSWRCFWALIVLWDCLLFFLSFLSILSTLHFIFTVENKIFLRKPI